MPRGASLKRERGYEALKAEFKEEGRYRGREEDVASRIVNKQRAQLGETKAAQSAERQHRAADEGLPIENYDHMTVAQISRKLGILSPGEVGQIQAYEESHRNRRTLLEAIERYDRLRTAA